MTENYCGYESVECDSSGIKENSENNGDQENQEAIHKNRSKEVKGEAFNSIVAENEAGYESLECDSARVNEYTETNNNEEDVNNSNVVIILNGESSERLLEPSLSESFRSVPVAGENAWWPRKLMSYMGPGALVAVGYMDPGNWSTDVAGGSAFGYKLLFVVLLSSMIAAFLQCLAAKLGIVFGRDLAQVCRDNYSERISFVLWIIMEIAIAATDLAEIIGSAIALNLLFSLPIVAGICITAADILLVLFLKGSQIRTIEKLITTLVFIIGISFIIELSYSRPKAVDVLSGYVPDASLITNTEMLFVGVSIIGATVMPHNLFLHSSLVLTRASRLDREGQKEAIRYATIDSCISLFGAFFVNSSILIVAAAAFYKHGYHDVASLQDAYHLLSPVLGAKLASIVFGVGLLASGQSATFTGTFAGQIVMEGFINMKLSPMYRRMLTRMLAIVPAVIIVSVSGEEAVNGLLIVSQIILSFALPFAMFPLVQFTCNKDMMGPLVNEWYIKWIAYLSLIIITCLDAFLIVDSFM